MNTHSTRTEAIAREITDALGADAANFDIDAIADKVLGDYTAGYACIVDTDEFWTIVENHAL